ncbi:terminase small subunit [Clostridium sp.]|uniref:terminase small subunit n=1 Tax=Clostridium sp. TaxID=1506 RepID=UPI00284247BE|nr:terminase small subunit [Clostridium sp.]MDR3594293.1 terminase small subunit [Clostridium sp.]
MSSQIQIKNNQIPKLTNKQRIFCNEYLVTLNATDAAIKAGYSEKTANVIGPENLSKPCIKAYLEMHLKKREERTEICQDHVLIELRRIAFFDPGKLFDENGKLKKISDMDEDTRAVIAGVDISTSNGKNKEISILEITKKLKFVDKMKALELLGRHLGMFIDRGELHIVNETLEDVIIRRKKNPENRS